MRSGKAPPTCCRWTACARWPATAWLHCGTSVDGWLVDAPEDAAPAIRATLDALRRHLDDTRNDRDALEAGARGLAFTLARCSAAALLARNASWGRQRGDMRPGAALRRFVGLGLNRLNAMDSADTHLLTG